MPSRKRNVTSHFFFNHRRVLILNDTHDYSGLPSSTVGVVNLAGSLILDPLKLWTSKYREQCYSSRVSTTQCLALAARQLPKPVPFVATSAIGYYPVDSKEVFNENSQSDNSFFAHMCADIERAALQAEVSVLIEIILL